MNNISDIPYLIKNNKSVAIHKKSINSIRAELNQIGLIVEIPSPNSQKEALKNIAIGIGIKLTKQTSKYSILDLKEMIEDKLTKLNKVIIVIDEFHIAQKKSVVIFKDLNKISNVCLICRYYGKSNTHVKTFFEDLILYKKEEEKDIIIKYSYFILITAIPGILYLKLAFTFFPIDGTAIIGALWFAMVIFRTLTYVVK